MIRLSWSAVALVALLMVGPVRGQTYFRASLAASHMPGSHNTATAEAFLTLSSDRTKLSYTINLYGLDLEPNSANRTHDEDVVGMHFHRTVPDAIGPHILNIFGLAAPGIPAEDDADLLVDYENESVSGIFDDGDATIDPATGEPYLQFFFLTSKIMSDWLDELEAGQLYLAVHTVGAGGGPLMHGDILPVPEAATSVLTISGIAFVWMAPRRRPGTSKLVKFSLSVWKR